MGGFSDPFSLKKILIDGPPKKLSGLKMIERFAVFADLLFCSFMFLLSAELLFSYLARGARGSMRSGEEACFFILVASGLCVQTQNRFRPVGRNLQQVGLCHSPPRSARISPYLHREAVDNRRPQCLSRIAEFLLLAQ